MTPAEWKLVEERLETVFGPEAKLNCDGYEVLLSLCQINPFKNAICVFVNGWFKGEWLTGESEEGRRFFPQKSAYLHKPKVRASLGKFSKKMLLEMGLDPEQYNPDKKYLYRGAYWTSFGAMKHHFIKNNKSIELLPILAGSEISISAEVKRDERLG